jgi:hypothetical protein
MFVPGLPRECRAFGVCVCTWEGRAGENIEAAMIKKNKDVEGSVL